LSSAIYFIFFPKTYSKYQEPVESKIEIRFPSQLDGLEIDSEENQAPDVLGVMIDNHPDAYPQSGLNEAKIVYEAPAEGGITRYLAIFDKNQTVEKVGPVRSARPYYLDWLNEYGDALYMHCGGSPAALNAIKQENIFDANEFSHGQYYWRDNARSAPHNLYTDSEKWQKLFEDYSDGRPVKAWSGWKFDENFVVVSSTPMKEIKIVYGLGYEVVWKYNTEGGYFERYVDGQPHLDNVGVIITTKNILVQFTKTEILDEVGRREISTVDEGEGRVLFSGQIMQARWKKEGASERTIFFNEDKNEIKLKPGKTWVEIIPIGTKIEITN